MTQDDRHYSEVEAEQNAQEEQTYNPILEPELEFLRDLRVHKINGKLALGDEQLPFNVAKIYSEQEFVDTWLIQFALGNHYGINYFNHQAWGKETNLGTLAAMVVDEEGKPVLFVPPVISTNMTDRDYELLRMASWTVNNNMNDNMKKNDPNASLDVANKIHQHLTKKSMTLTELIVPEFYAKHGIVPEVEQQAFYLRDVINNGQVHTKDMVEVRELLYKIHRGESLTKDEKEKLNVLSRGQFELTAPEAEKPKDNNSDDEQPFSPFEC
ncbi:hypothetical protein AVA65_08350 [Salmonella enterica subsp. enterica serovar Minnesota]|nr:hypothetical protein [Salmonella enterica subsp. enterica serovar Minnesota]